MLAAGRVLWLVHRRELVHQAASELERLAGGPVGVVMAEANGHGAPIVVASVQSLSEARLAAILSAGPLSLAVVDECHHVTAANRYGAIVRRLASRSCPRTDRHAVPGRPGPDAKRPAGVLVLADGRGPRGGRGPRPALVAPRRRSRRSASTGSRSPWWRGSATTGRRSSSGPSGAPA